MKRKLFSHTVDPDAPPSRAHADPAVVQARLDVARRQMFWVESAARDEPILRDDWLLDNGYPADLEDIVANHLVDAETDIVYLPRRGAVFAPDNASIAYVPDGARLGWYADDTGHITFLDHEGRTWTSILERKAAAQARVRAPRR